MNETCFSRLLALCQCKREALMCVLECVWVCICDYLHAYECSLWLCTRGQENIFAYHEETVEGQHPQSGFVLSWAVLFQNGRLSMATVCDLKMADWIQQPLQLYSTELPVSSVLVSPFALSPSLSLTLFLRLLPPDWVRKTDDCTKRGSQSQCQLGLLLLMLLSFVTKRFSNIKGNH